MMAFLELNLYEHPSGATLVPEAVIEKLTKCFPEVIVLPGDQLAASVKQIEAWTADDRQRNPESPLHRILTSERRKARTFGPAYAFRLPIAGEGLLRGQARRSNVTFLFDNSLSEATRQRLLAFLQAFGVGWIEASTEDERQSEILLDMRGMPEAANGFSGSRAIDVAGTQPSEMP